MSIMRKSNVLPVVLGSGLLFLSGCAHLESNDQMNQGVIAFKNNKYPDAVRHFQEAVRLDPNNTNAQAYLATSYFIQWVPGADSPDNKKNYDMAQAEFKKILQKDPSNEQALASMASMAYNSATSAPPDKRKAAFEEARKWNERRIEVNPKDGEAYYYLGVIDYYDALGDIQTARVTEKLTGPNDPGPLPDKKVRADLKDKYGKTIDSGLDQLKKALAIDKENEDAMSYVNLLLREKAALADSPEEAKALWKEADDWLEKSLNMKRIKAARPAKQQTS
ncbi:MAG TPA: tetratricopeptide repeat protein [Bryobacteraceae bacterium]|jgi:tetratricopeptide (TPR) repeat protein|nr:tetratricopeptide repeat protein [Bryobacteraceae bacterium]